MPNDITCHMYDHCSNSEQLRFYWCSYHRHASIDEHLFCISKTVLSYNCFYLHNDMWQKAYSKRYWKWILHTSCAIDMARIYVEHMKTIYHYLAPGNPTLWRGSSSSHTKIFRIERARLKTEEKMPISGILCTYRFVRYSSICYSKVRIDPLMSNMQNPDFFFAFPVVNAAWSVVVRSCQLNRDLLNAPKGN